MTPELQKLIAQAEQAQRHGQIIGYTTYAAILVCAVFSVLIFWKLCQIQRLLACRPEHPPSPTPSPASQTPPKPDQPTKDDSRYMPKR